MLSACANLKYWSVNLPSYIKYNRITTHLLTQLYQLYYCHKKKHFSFLSLNLTAHFLTSDGHFQSLCIYLQHSSLKTINTYIQQTGRDAHKDIETHFRYM